MEVFFAIGFLCGAYTPDCTFMISSRRHETRAKCTLVIMQMTASYPRSNLYCMERSEIEQIKRTFEALETKT